jgi:hypothetical protein
MFSAGRGRARRTADAVRADAVPDGGAGVVARAADDRDDGRTEPGDRHGVRDPAAHRRVRDDVARQLDAGVHLGAHPGDGVARRARGREREVREGGVVDACADGAREQDAGARRRGEARGGDCEVEQCSVALIQIGA